MGKSKLQIPKVCPYCGKEFLAKTITTVYCSEVCCWKKANENRKKVRALKAKMKLLAQIKGSGEEFITTTQAVQVFTVSRNTIRRLILNQKIEFVKVSQRKILVSMQSMERLFPLRVADMKPKEPPRNTIFDFAPEKCYTISEISQKYCVTEYSVYHHIRKYSVPTRQVGRFVYAPKSEIDKLYNNQKPK